MKVFGSDNVMIVDSADMKSRQQETMEVRPGLNFPRALACVEPQPYLPCTDTQRWGFPFLARVVSRLLLFLTVWRTRETSPSHPSRELCLSSDKSWAPYGIIPVCGKGEQRYVPFLPLSCSLCPHPTPHCSLVFELCVLQSAFPVPLCNVFALMLQPGPVSILFWLYSLFTSRRFTGSSGCVQQTEPSSSRRM